MPLTPHSKRECCPKCKSYEMINRLLVRPGEESAVFVECAACGEFVARYTLKNYTCEDPYRSFLRQMRHQRMSSGAAAHKTGQEFADRLWADWEEAKRLPAEGEIHHIEDLLDEFE